LKYLKKFTVKEWKKFNKPVQADNSITFRNFLKTKELWLQDNPEDSFEIHVSLGGHVKWVEEAYDHWTLQEVLLSKYKVILTDHKNKWGVGVLCPVPLSEKIKNIPQHITQQNFDKGMKKFDKGMNTFSKAVDTFTSGLGDMGEVANKEMGKSKHKPRKKDQDNLKSLMGSKKKSKPMTLWSKPKPQKRKIKKRKKKSRSDVWDSHEDDMTKLWGDRKR
jgi:hypothetical protein